MTSIRDNSGVQKNYYDYANNTAVNNQKVHDENVVADNNSNEKMSVGNSSNELSQESTYSKKTLLGMDKKDILANMLEHMSNAEKSEKIRELKGEINPAEIYSFRINNGKVEISGGDGFAGKARAYEKLVNASLNSSWNQLFHSSSISENSLMDKINGIFRFYMDEDYSIQKQDRKDSIENHITDAFDKWKKSIQPERMHFNGRI
ncbi:MAG: hypothetical protein Q4D51_12535 [Eubacteriales bacterium]|nr:hypothetical protein [Eubacteriales bacterium]